MAKPVSNGQPDKFFADAKGCLAVLQGIPVIALDRLRQDELTRDVIVSIIRQCFDIIEDAGMNLAQEIEKQDLRNNAEANLKELMRDDRLISLDELKRNGLKLAFSDNGPIVVPA